ncbi:MAG TPA: hypothetical protein VNN62_07685 [Methylomirabilota bacterium]|nr:hypothetical protein [Methylomirabilota bacterium]
MEEGYGWILPGEPEKQRETRAVRGFWEQPTPVQAQDLWRGGALWNTFVCIAQSGAPWGMVRRAAAEVHERFGRIRQALGASYAESIIEQTYNDMPSVNFCSGVCEPLATEFGGSDSTQQEVSMQRRALEAYELGYFDGLCEAHAELLPPRRSIIDNGAARAAGAYTSILPIQKDLPPG